MSVTLEQAHILTREMNMDSSSLQQAIDVMRRWVGLMSCDHVKTFESIIIFVCKNTLDCMYPQIGFI